MLFTSQCQIEGNTIRIQSRRQRWIRIEGNADNVSIRNNQITRRRRRGHPHLPALRRPSSNVTINNNDFVGNKQGGVVVDAGGYTGTLDATTTGGARQPVPPRWPGRRQAALGNGTIINFTAVANGADRRPDQTAAADSGVAIRASPSSRLSQLLADLTAARPRPQ